MAEKRDKVVKVRFTEGEYREACARSTRPEVARWLREFSLGQPVPRPSRAADPELLRSLAQIGNNLNQIARALNGCRLSSDTVDTTALLLELRRVRQTLEVIGAGQDS